MPDLTDDDYDALYAAVREEMPRVTRFIFPDVLGQLVRDGILAVTVSDSEITIAMPGVAEFEGYRVDRKRKLH